MKKLAAMLAMAVTAVTLAGCANDHRPEPRAIGAPGTAPSGPPYQLPAPVEN